ncbi:leucine-rich repeat domain-containing protein [Aliarcobacter cryaerophilus]|uniref:leucine-rich repeat domain-containing protein n=1 Tax=Aliarcobacter cryaerophilus TaxID=28198 RepID=UPI003DA56F10
MTKIIEDTNTNDWYNKFCQWAEKYYLNDEFGNIKFIDKDSLENITELNICDKNINEIPPQIENLSNLLVVLADCNNIKELPLELFKLKSLAMLSLSNNNISAIPNEIEKVNIFYLDISNNPIKTLPEIIYKKKRISNLLLHNTNIQNIPEDICQLKNLTALTFDDKHLPTVVKYISYFPNINSINLTHSNYDETSPLIQNLNLKYDKKEWLKKEHKKSNGVIKIFQETTLTPEDDMEGMVEYGLSVVNNEPEEALRIYYEAMELYEENNRKYPLPAETIDLSIEIVLNTAKVDIQQAINMLDIIEVEDFKLETIDKLLLMTEEVYYKVVLNGMKEGVDK